MKSPNWRNANCISSAPIRRPMLSAADPTFQLKESIEARYRANCKVFQS